MSSFRTRTFATALSLGLLASSGLAQTPAGAPSIALPTTPVGRVATEWLDAFNSGDSTKLGAYYRKHGLERSLENQMAFRRRTGGFDVVSIEKSERWLIEYVVREKATGNQAYAVMELRPGADSGLRQSALAGMQPGVTAANFKIDAATRARVIENAIAQLDSTYVFPDVAAKMADTVRARAKRGDYNSITNGLSFATLLTEHFREISNDRHLGLGFSALPVPNRRPGGPDSAARANQRRNLEAQNCGFVASEIQANNVGYLKFNFFANPEICAPFAAKAMNAVADADALIIDLRENGGGDPAMVAYVSSYLFDERTHLNDLWTRRGNETREYWTRDVPGKKLGGTKPVYVLTARRTFSGAEEFSYNLKNLKRATIVGETTGGGAHPVQGHKIDEHFTIGVPFARAINPISKTNWEGVGVEPDVKVPAAEALATAQRLIAEKRGVRP